MPCCVVGVVWGRQCAEYGRELSGIHQNASGGLLVPENGSAPACGASVYISCVRFAAPISWRDVLYVAVGVASVSPLRLGEIFIIVSD